MICRIVYYPLKNKKHINFGAWVLNEKILHDIIEKYYSKDGRFDAYVEFDYLPVGRDLKNYSKNNSV